MRAFIYKLIPKYFSTLLYIQIQINKQTQIEIEIANFKTLRDAFKYVCIS